MNSATPDRPRIRRSPVRNPQLFAALVLFALLAIASRPASAQTYARAWVWSTYTDTTTHTWTPSLAYQYNSQGGTNVITHLGTGYYRVDMPGIYTDSSTGGGGTVLVTAYGGNQSCNPARWLIDSGGVHVYVECFNPAGSASDALFDALYYRRGNGWFQAYVWANNATASSYIPYLAYQWNSVGLTNSITRSGTGSYVVTIPGFPWNTALTTLTLQPACSLAL